MAFSDLDDFISKLASAPFYGFSKIGAGTGGKVNSLWTTTPNGASAPSTAVALSNTTTGALLKPALPGSITNPLWLSQIEITGDTTAGTCYVLCDRLCEQGGLSGTDTATQTTNMPTAALTRYTDGVGVFAAVEIYTQVGTTARTLTAVYTNQAGTGSRTTKPIVFGATDTREAGKLLTLPLQDGDTGVRSVESVTISASTGTAGNFGITLFKPLAILPLITSQTKGVTPAYQNLLVASGAKLIEVQDNACLFLTGSGAGGGNTGRVVGYLKVVEA